MNTITHRALCAFRDQRAIEAQALLHSASLLKGDSYWINLDKAANAFADSEAAHKELGCEFPNPCYNACDLMVTLLRESIGTKAEEAYARAEQQAEEASIAKFHRDAYGE